MLLKTQGIVLSYIPYRETSIIVKIYTEKLGLQSYIVNRVRSASGNTKIALFQPLTILDMVVYYKQGRGLNRIAEMKCLLPYRTIPYQQKKICIALFISEVLEKTLRTEFPDYAIYSYIHNAFAYFDELERGYENFHLVFLLQLSSLLGFRPASAELVYTELGKTPIKEEIEALSHFMKGHSSESLPISTPMRRNILDALIAYYKWHLNTFLDIHSDQILKEVLT